MSKKSKPAHGTGEWAKHNVNIQRGCRNGCLYCYAQGMAVRFGRATPDSWADPEIVQAKVDRQYRKMTGRIMFPTTHDLDPRNIDACLTVLKKMLAAGNEVLIVSKPRLECIRRLCTDLEAFKGQIMFRFTIGSASDDVLGAWEPGAPSFAERLASLEHAFRAGYRTSVSCEPMLDTGIDAVIRQVRPYVNDSIWLGKANNLGASVALNCPGDGTVKEMAVRLNGVMTDGHIHGLYSRYGKDPLIKWKDSLKKILGLGQPTEKGMDV